MLPRMHHLAALVALAVAAGRAEANVSKWWREASPAGEPGGIDAIAIAREDLVIDLRPLAADGLVEVSATYHLDNASGEKRLELVFAAGSGTAGFEVTLDSRPVPSTDLPGVELPAAYRPPASTPLLDGGEVKYRLDGRAVPRGFVVTVPPGRHDLAISYRARAMRDDGGGPTWLHQFAYVLAPARTWAGFGGLDVQVHVPPGWRAAVTPAMAREGDTLRGSFATIPADAIALTVQAPSDWHGLVKVASFVLFVLVALGGCFVVAWRTRVRERRSERFGPSRLAALGRGFLLGLAVLGSGMLAVLGPDLLLAEGQAAHRGYGQAFAFVGVILGSLLMTVIGTIVSLVSGHGVHDARISKA